MAYHNRRILRQYRTLVTTTSYVSLNSIAISSFLLAGSVVGADKWTFVGELRCVLARYSTGGGGHKLPFVLSKAPSASTGVLVVGSPTDFVGISTQLCNVVLASSSTVLTIQGRTDTAGSSSIILVEMEGLFTGGAGPVS